MATRKYISKKTTIERLNDISPEIRRDHVTRYNKINRLVKKASSKTLSDLFSEACVKDKKLETIKPLRIRANEYCNKLSAYMFNESNDVRSVATFMLPVLAQILIDIGFTVVVKYKDTRYGKTLFYQKYGLADSKKTTKIIITVTNDSAWVYTLDININDVDSPDGLYENIKVRHGATLRFFFNINDLDFIEEHNMCLDIYVEDSLSVNRELYNNYIGHIRHDIVESAVISHFKKVKYETYNNLTINEFLRRVFPSNFTDDITMDQRMEPQEMPAILFNRYQNGEKIYDTLFNRKPDIYLFDKNSLTIYIIEIGVSYTGRRYYKEKEVTYNKHIGAINELFYRQGIKIKVHYTPLVIDLQENKIHYRQGVITIESSSLNICINLARSFDKKVKNIKRFCYVSKETDDIPDSIIEKQRQQANEIKENPYKGNILSYVSAASNLEDKQFIASISELDIVPDINLETENLDNESNIYVDDTRCLSIANTVDTDSDFIRNIDSMDIELEMDTVLETCLDVTRNKVSKKESELETNSYLDSLKIKNKEDYSVFDPDRSRPKSLSQFIVPLSKSNSDLKSKESISVTADNCLYSVTEATYEYFHNKSNKVTKEEVLDYINGIRSITDAGSFSGDYLKKNYISKYGFYKVKKEDREKTLEEKESKLSNKENIHGLVSIDDPTTKNYLEEISKNDLPDVPYEDMIYNVPDTPYFKEISEYSLDKLSKIYKLIKSNPFLKYSYSLFNILHQVRHIASFCRSHTDFKVIQTFSTNLIYIIGTGPSTTGDSSIIPIQFMGQCSKAEFSSVIVPNFNLLYYNYSYSIEKNDIIVTYITVFYRLSKEVISQNYFIYANLSNLAVYIGEKVVNGVISENALNEYIKSWFIASTTSDEKTCSFLDYYKYLYPMITGGKYDIKSIIKDRMPKVIDSFALQYFINKIVPNIHNIFSYFRSSIIESETGDEVETNFYLTTVGEVTSDITMGMLEVNIYKMTAKYHKSNYHTIRSVLATIKEFEEKGKDTCASYNVQKIEFDTIDDEEKFIFSVLSKIDTNEMFLESDSDSEFEDEI